MASNIDLSSDEGLRAFREDCQIPDDVVVRPHIEGEEVAHPFFLISSYLLLIVGLRFPLPVSFCDLLQGLDIPLHKCRPNVARLLWGIAALNERLGLFLRAADVARCYIMGIDNGGPYFRPKTEGKDFVRGLDFPNKNWQRYPWVLVAGNWLENDGLSPPADYNPDRCRQAFTDLRGVVPSEDDMEAFNQAIEAGMSFSYLKGRPAENSGVGSSSATAAAAASGSRRYTRSMATGARPASRTGQPEGPVSLSTSTDSSSSEDASPPPGPSRKGKEREVEEEPQPSPKRSRPEVFIDPRMPGSWSDFSLVNMEERLQAVEKMGAELQMDSALRGVDVHALELAVEGLTAKVAALEEEVKALKDKGT